MEDSPESQRLAMGQANEPRKRRHVDKAAGGLAAGAQDEGQGIGQSQVVGHEAPRGATCNQSLGQDDDQAEGSGRELVAAGGPFAGEAMADAHFRGALQGIVREAAIGGVGGRKMLGACEETRELKEKNAGFVREKFGVSYDDMTHPTLEATLAVSASLMGMCVCRIAGRETLCKDDDLQLLLVCMCHADQFVKGAVVQGRKALWFYDGLGWEALTEKGVFPESIWSGLRRTFRILRGLSATYLAQQLRRHSDGASSLPPFNAWLASAPATAYVAPKSGEVGAGAFRKLFDLGKSPNFEAPASPTWHLVRRGYLAWKIFAYLGDVDFRLQKCPLFYAFVDRVFREHCVDRAFSALLANRPPISVLSFQDMSLSITAAAGSRSSVAAKRKTPADFCIGTLPWYLGAPADPAVEADLDAQIAENFGGEFRNLGVA